MWAFVQVMTLVAHYNKAKQSQFNKKKTRNRDVTVSSAPTQKKDPAGDSILNLAAQLGVQARLAS